MYSCTVYLYRLYRTRTDTRIQYKYSVVHPTSTAYRGVLSVTISPRSLTHQPPPPPRNGNAFRGAQPM